MLHPRIQNLFRMLDTLLPLGLLAELEVGHTDLQFAFEFKGEGEVGTLTIYQGLRSGPKVHVETEWFHHSRAWFRRNPITTPGACRYEAYIEYVADYRDDVMVDLAKPICWVELEEGKKPALFTPETARTPMAKAIVQSNLCPELF